MSKSNLNLIRHTLFFSVLFGLFLMMPMIGNYWRQLTFFRQIIELIISGSSITAINIVVIIFTFITIIFSLSVSIFVIIYCFKGFKAKQIKLINFAFMILLWLVLICLLLVMFHLREINDTRPQQAVIFPAFAFYLLWPILLLGFSFYPVKLIVYLINKNSQAKPSNIILPTNLSTKFVGLMALMLASILIFSLSTTFIRISFGVYDWTPANPAWRPWYENFWLHFVYRFFEPNNCIAYLVRVLGMSAFISAIGVIGLGVLQLTKEVEVKWFNWIFYLFAGLCVLLGVFNLVYVFTFDTPFGPTVWDFSISSSPGVGAFLVFSPGLLFFTPLINKLNRSTDTTKEK